MKTVSGEVLSTNTISVSKAAKVLSNFVAAETGASQAVSAYLRRASAEFNELVQFHKELKASKSDRKLKKHAQESADNGDLVKYDRNLEEKEVGRRVEDIVRSDSGRNRDRKKRKRENEGVDIEGMDSLATEEKARMKRKSTEVDKGEAVASTEQSNSKKMMTKRRKI